MFIRFLVLLILRGCQFMCDAVGASLMYRDCTDGILLVCCKQLLQQTIIKKEGGKTKGKKLQKENTLNIEQKR